MHIFEFKAPGTPGHFFIDLESIQIISGLTYKEEPYVADRDFGPTSGNISGGHSRGSFTVSMALRTDVMEVTHGGSCQAEKLKDQVAFAKQQGFELENGGIKRHSPDMKKYAEHLNKLPDPYLAGRAFKAEYKRLVAAWKACPPRNQ